MKIRKRDIAEFWIDRMASTGHGVARVDGFVIFVRGAIPGDRVMARIVRRKRDYASADLLELIDPSPDRVRPRCRYSGYCGGCQWQHVKYERQLEYKREHIRDVMSRIGSLHKVPVHEVIPSRDIFGYRNKMEFSFSDRQWRLPMEYVKGEKPGDPGLGLHVPGTFYKVIDINACLLQHDTGNQILRDVKGIIAKGRLPAYSLRTHKGFWRFLVLRYSAKSNEWMVNLVTSEDRREALSDLAQNLSKRFANIKTVINNVNTKKAAIALGEREIILTGEGYLQDKLGPFDFQVSASSFFQTNTTAAENLFNKVADYADLQGSETVLDLYCGTGTIPIFLSDRAGELIGIEISESAVLDANVNCEINNIGNCRFIQGDIREVIPNLNLKPDVLILDPPRAGIHKDILTGIMEMNVKRVVYVSCNPATMARDMVRMSENYEIREIQPVDMFPHTHHIEAVAKMMLRLPA